MRIFILFTALIFSLSCKPKISFEKNAEKGTNLNQLSSDYLSALRQGKSTTDIKSKLENLSVEDVSSGLKNDAHRYAFWINIYNAYIQDILKSNPDLYNDRQKFFAAKQISIMGDKYSFADIEHGILRKSQNEFGLGYIRKWFPPKWERKLRVDERDYRIHFALNCGAKDCPPVAIYYPKRINDQLNSGSKKYLNESTIYDPNTNTAKVTSLFSWFRGDFGGKKGSKKVLKRYDAIPKDKDPKLVYKNYDWTLYLDNYIDLD